MRRHISLRPLWRHLLRGLILCGACAGGSASSYFEWSRANPAKPADPPEECWDWSVPHQWYDMAHRR
ncbi:hypothetical protein [Nocardia iowensis]|uniref:Secreted protein n=1 Tax=Nocardia iowensis TaxID=204891 RepID=A0ABX8S067_NOCIO|nr:hypothetical protein [Nocardia iowensis]QXN94010.1 hypothetical protein KV110_13670 [Nocardia iowensis]